MTKRRDVLQLTRAHANNFRALCAFHEGRPVRKTADRRVTDQIPQALKLSLLQQQDYQCLDCGKDFYVNRGRCTEATIDHIVQFKYGGEANRDNIVLVCEACNLAREANYSMQIIEDHYGPVDISKLEYVPVLDFNGPRNLQASPIKR